MLYDISPPLDHRIAVWPGDTPLQREVLMDCENGDTITLSTLHTTVHLGAHADGPNHVHSGLPGIDARPLESFLGPCQLIKVRIDRGACIGMRHLPPAFQADRVLFATGTFPDPTVFNADFASLEPELVEHLANSGLRLVGIDTPSIDPFSSKDLPAHQACRVRNVAILEGLVLDHVPEGQYELIALPLRLVGFDASPVRAVLRSLNG